MDMRNIADSTMTVSGADAQASAVVLDFLGETYLETAEVGRVALRTLADRLGVTPPAVSRMSQRLLRRGYVQRAGACGLMLTDAGRRMALNTIRKRRVFEVFLVRMLGYTWDEVYPIAAASSNHLDDALINRMDDTLGHPRRCPHGDPIPTREGKIEQIHDMKLCELDVGADGVISRVSTHDGGMLRYLGSLGLTPGQHIRLVARAPFGGPLRVCVRRKGNGFDDEQVIGAELACVLWVEQPYHA